MEAGRALDRLIATQVFGVRLEKQCPTFQEQKCNGVHQTRCGSCGGHGHGGCYGNGSGQVQRRCEDICAAPSYSTDIADAWKVVEKLADRMLCIKVWMENCAGIRFDCVMYDDASGGDHAKGLWVHACEDTAPLAICRAALKAALKAVAHGGT